MSLKFEIIQLSPSVLNCESILLFSVIKQTAHIFSFLFRKSFQSTLFFFVLSFWSLLSLKHSLQIYHVYVSLEKNDKRNITETIKNAKFDLYDLLDIYPTFFLLLVFSR